MPVPTRWSGRRWPWEVPTWWRSRSLAIAFASWSPGRRDDGGRDREEGGLARRGLGVGAQSRMRLSGRAGLPNDGVAAGLDDAAVRRRGRARVARAALVATGAAGGLPGPVFARRRLRARHLAGRRERLRPRGPDGAALPVARGQPVRHCHPVAFSPSGRDVDRNLHGGAFRPVL